MKKNENGFNGFSAIDACILLKLSETPVSLRRIISSYPDQYEEHTTTSTGIDRPAVDMMQMETGEIK